ncbi:MAG: hypothetical protein HYU51_00610 [Candidatus Rokubacteria bacterium]|nr:hypothetical protein [Candidatus Rokubacteria bacterium]
MKANNRRKAFEVIAGKRRLSFPFARLEVQPTSEDRIAKVFVDQELGAEGITYVLRSGREGTVHIEEILEHNQDPGYLRDLLLLSKRRRPLPPRRWPGEKSFGGLAHRRPSSTDFLTRRTTGNPSISCFDCSGSWSVTSNSSSGRRPRSHRSVAVLKVPEVRDYLARQGAEPSGDTLEEFTKRYDAEIDKWAKVMHDAGVKGE